MTTTEVQTIFQAMTLYNGINRNVTAIEVGEYVVVWYSGDDSDLCLEIGYQDLRDHVKKNDLHYVYTSVDHGYFAEIDYWLEECLVEAVIHYVRNNLNFQIK